MQPIELYRMQRREALKRAFLAQQRRDMPPTQTPRKMPRARLALPISIHGEGLSGSTHDVSAGGCGFFLEHKPARSDLRLSLHLPNGDWIRCLGTVVGCMQREDSVYVCVRFDAIAEPHPGALEDVVLEALLAAAPDTN